jgi:hypothetical protein
MSWAGPCPALEMSSVQWTILCLVALASVVVIDVGRRRLKRQKSPSPYPLPPGPPPLPIVGNMHGVDVKAPWLTYSEWSKVYGMSDPHGLSLVYVFLRHTRRQATSYTHGCSTRTSSLLAPGRLPKIFLKTVQLTTRTDRTSSPMNCEFSFPLPRSESHNTVCSSFGVGF